MWGDRARVREVISQTAATFCIQVPTLEAKAAIHK
jgi:hypothetical protein